MQYHKAQGHDNILQMALLFCVWKEKCAFLSEIEYFSGGLQGGKSLIVL